jgi:hypothetical protein
VELVVDGITGIGASGGLRPPAAELVAKLPELRARDGERPPVVAVDVPSGVAVDTGDGLSPQDAAGIMRFRERGGGILTARDNQDVGSSVGRLGSIGRLNQFHHHNPYPGARRDETGGWTAVRA